ncbi:MAG: sulfatase-like hydrolase/transferase [Flavobacteriales bacterium]|nr:sulfatase-like hydrolase/transferase [Flavobacteriales bacterium]
MDLNRTFALALYAAFTSTLHAQPRSDTEQRPDLILIVVDDLGWSDIGLHGQDRICTPNIDRIGLEGAIFDRGYVTSSACSPSRAALLTGRYQQRFGHEHQPVPRYARNLVERAVFAVMPTFRPLVPNKVHPRPTASEIQEQGLPPSETTLAELLSIAGYRTGMVGKWHLGTTPDRVPCARGFSQHYGFHEAFTLYMDPEATDVLNTPIKGQFMDRHQWRSAAGRTGACSILRDCGERCEPPQHLTRAFTDEAIAFLSASDDRPSFLYLAYSAPHVPLQALSSYHEAVAHVEDPVQRTYLAMILQLDDEIGRLLDHLEQRGTAENTLLVFISDNGGAAYNGTTDNAPLRGGKLTDFEGGLRVPFLIRWPQVIPNGTTYSHPVISMDVFATLARAAGVVPPSEKRWDGVDLLSALNTREPAHEALFWRVGANRAVRKGSWKLIENDLSRTSMLFDLESDPGELKDLSTFRPDLVTELRVLHAAWSTGNVGPIWPNSARYVLKERGMGKLKYDL